MGKHTPGPWEVWPHGKDRQICIGHLESHSNLVRAICQVDMDDVANARLIAAAPDLLAAAEDMDAWTKRDVPGALSPSEWLLGGCVNDFAASLAKLRAALAAARGEE
jgi:hypothetical protein